MRELAIIGFGPRGLYSLECLCANLSKKKKVQHISISIFENEEDLGAGKVWNTKQPDINWINISERALKGLSGRKEINFGDFTIPAFPSYKKWLPKKDKFLSKITPDKFPPRNKVGRYLVERANSIIAVLEKHKMVKTSNAVIVNIDFDSKKFTLTDLEKNTFFFDEVLLTIGHQTTKFDKDVETYEIQSLDKKHTSFSQVYPLETIIKSKKIAPNTNVAIRGLGLSMIDAVRALTIEKGGSFKILDKKTFELEFIASKEIPYKIIPYSLDGLPMAPKPIHAKMDAIFKPSKKQLKLFKKSIKNIASGKEETTGNEFLKKVTAQVSAEVYLNLENRIPLKIDKKEVKKIITYWLEDNFYKHELIEDSNQDIATILASFVEMAIGKRAVSLDYCVGQVVRHCQPTLYKIFSHANVSEEIIGEVIKLDEQLKRYSYGPPIESLQQLLALHKAKVVDFSFADNPKIEHNEKGWKFSKDGKEITVNVIVNSVLSAPKVLDVTAPIILNLLKNEIIKPIHTKLGVHTNKNGTIINADKKEIPLAVLGRLAKGSVIGVDAILECFGSRIKDWAKGCVERIEN
ncbi:FAD/NAD(P)-binding protein [Polaribacter cellanae]|uniref:FAD/NAD(P)-binding protein n=1 Tax=Polaribacter cellanae TaxID=2818493 RepID=A0A975H726_9FLAO|nr:FAD/NAD(P)-binding protein [Polaribacter cellanae]QTE22544.1 FAD/NAD(P)-binding protein [Polaribacter cellanae]